jgi:hypothetical protein
MRRAISKEKDKVIDIIVNAIEVNPKIQYLLGENKFPKKVRALAQFIYSISERRNAIYLSEDGNGLLIYMHSSVWRKNWRDFWDHCQMIAGAFEWSRLVKILKMEKELESLRPINEEYLYVWVLGTKIEHQGGNQARELRDALFLKSTEMRLPIYAETAFDQNFIVYQRFGFEPYHTQHYPEIPLTIRFLKRALN